MKTLKQLRDRRAEIVQKGEAVIAGYDGRDPTDDELGKIKALSDERKQVEAEISALEARQEMEREFRIDAGARVSGGRERAEDDPTRGFINFGEFAGTVWRASRAGGVIDERLRIGAAPTSYANESSGGDGGFLVPPAFSARIMEHALEENAFLPMTDNDNISGNSMAYPADETTPWGTTGIRAYWEAEGAQATQTKPALEPRSMRLHKLFALAPMTDELLADTMALSSYIERKAGESIRWKTNNAFMNGTGAGQPQGVLGAGALVVQAKEGSQAADTIVAANIVKMFSRALNPGRSVWMINPDAFPQLPLMTLGDQPVFVMPGNITQTPAGTLLGRPIIPTDTCKTVGDQGDIALVDWMAYKTITKAGGVQTATSIHLWFDYDTTAFRVTFRIDGQPWLRQAVTPPNSSITRSSFVTLAARA